VTTWHVITGEYPPQRGGVSDYTRQLACGLVEAGDRVEVWAPPCTTLAETGREDPRITVHRLPDSFGFRSLWRLERALNRTGGPHRILVQYVPRSFGLNGGNIAFCLWVRSRRRDSTWVMFHEVMFQAEGDRRVRRQVLAAVNRWMATLVAGATERAFVSIPGWRAMLDRRLPPDATVTWLPVPSTVPVIHDSAGTARIRARYVDGQSLVGHFGTYGSMVGALLDRTLLELAAISDCRVLLLGDGSTEACQRMTSNHVSLVGRLSAAGRLSPDDLSRHIAACDVMLQPYPDGVSTRRTSAMVALSHGRPLVTTAGRLTEPLWAETGAGVLVPADDCHALAVAAAAMLFDPSRREAVGRRGAALYQARFDSRHTIAALRASDENALAEAGAA
jgi:hypothetical protein